MGYNFARAVDEIAINAPERLAVLCVDEDGRERRLTYGQLRRDTNRLASALARVGLGRGQRVLVLLPRGVEPYVVYLALLKLGATVMPGSEMLRAGDIRYRVQHAEASVVIAHA
ncbi:MAG: AMP-binding protein, partial [Alicyclobacillus macrosporangiidus]|uniref:AMP-binding protein n=1 Tax=Alicyclobacillus macrosporangiidus TaxID=392015 RepID=UPI0026ED32F6